MQTKKQASEYLRPEHVRDVHATKPNGHARDVHAISSNVNTTKYNVREITFAQALYEATDYCLTNDPQVFVMGLGVDDPKGIFGTTLDLHKKHGEHRVFDVPVSELALTGIAVGAATMGMRPILTHQRLDFALLSLDQIINNAAKWHYMFGGIHKAPITIRMVIGRGWGQGPQHSQSHQALFAHIPGLKVVMPTTAHDAKGLLISSIEDNNPVLFLEHRWLHFSKGHVPTEAYREPLSKCNVVREGKDLTIVAISYMVLEAYRVAEVLSQYGIEVEVIDLRTLKPFDGNTILESVQKTGRALVADTGHLTCGMSAEILAYISENVFSSLKSAPRRVALPDAPTPTSSVLAQAYYPRSQELAKIALEVLGKQNTATYKQVLTELKAVEDKTPSDVPDFNFTGPF